MNTIWITKAARYCLYALMLISAINVISNFMQINLMNSYFVNSEFSDDVYAVLADQNDARIEIIGLIYAVILFSSFFIIGRWLYLSSKINHLLEIKNLQYSPGWCVGWHFIPFASLVMPYRALKEIFRASFNKENWEKEEIPHDFPAWWTTWLLGNAIAQGSLRMGMQLGENYSYDELNLISCLDISSDVLQIVCAFALLRIISVISNNHQNINFKTSHEQET